MTDLMKKRPIKITVSGEGYADFSLPVEQLDQVRALFDANNIRYWVGEEYLSIDDGPEIAFIEVSRNSDPKLAQRLLDSVP
jgi:hypothetical protein